MSEAIIIIIIIIIITITITIIIIIITITIIIIIIIIIIVLDLTSGHKVEFNLLRMIIHLQDFLSTGITKWSPGLFKRLSRWRFSGGPLHFKLARRGSRGG